MSVKDNFPALKPSLLLDFANTKVLDPRVTFSRASTAVVYDGKTVAKAEENLLLRSQEFDNASWSKNLGATISANAIASPDGTTTADAYTQAASPTTELVSQTATVASGAISTFSVFAKKNVGDWLRIAVGSGSNYFICSFDLTNGVKGTDVSLGTGVLVSSSISASANGFYRVSITGYIPSTTSYPCLIFVADADNSGTRLSNGSAYIWGAQLEQRSTVTAYTPTTDQPITNYIPVLQTAQANTARFDHNPVTGESLGLRVEEQRTNLWLYSEQFDNAAWTKANVTVTTNTIVAPDGTLTGDKLVESTANGQHAVYVVRTFASGAHTLSFYAKAAERVWVNVDINTGANFGASFNLSNGTIGTIQSGFTAAIQSVGNGWYRCSVTLTTSAIPYAAVLRVSKGDVTSGSDSNINYTGDGYSGVYIWGAQLEAGSFATSYIPTVASQVTRSADSAIMTGTNFSSWYRADEGTLYVEAKAGGSGGRFFELASSAAVYMASYMSTSTNINQLIYTNGATQTSFNKSTTYNANTKQVLAYKTNDFAGCFDGGVVGTDTTGLVPFATGLYIGQYVTGGFQLNNCISKLAYYPVKLSSVQLQALTS